MHRRVVSIPELVLGALRLCRRLWLGILIAAVSFAMILAAVSGFSERRIAQIEDRMAAHLKMSDEEFQAETERQVRELGTLDAVTFVESLQRHGSGALAGKAPLPAKNELGIAYIAQVGPYVFLLLAVNLFVGFAAFIYFLLFFTRITKSPYETIPTLLRNILPMSFAWFWALVRSYIWIPLIGPFLALYMTPRLAPAFVYIASGEAGVFEGFHLSIKRTKGHWFGAALGLLVICIVTFALVLWPAMVVAAIASLFSLKIGFVLWLIGAMLAIAFFSACLTVLGVMLA